MQCSTRTQTHSQAVEGLIDNWTRLADQYRVGWFRAHRGTPIHDAVLLRRLPPGMVDCGRAIAFHCEALSIDSSPLFLFLEVPNPLAPLDLAMVVVHRLATKVIAGRIEGPSLDNAAAASQCRLNELRAQPGDAYLNVSEAALLMAISPVQIKRAIQSGKLCAKNWGSGGQAHLKIQKADLDSYQGVNHVPNPRADAPQNRARRKSRVTPYNPQILK